MILNKIKNMDFKEYLKSIPDNSVDFAFFDPPYSILKKMELEAGFNPDTDIDWLFKELKRIMKNNTFIAFFGMHRDITKGIYKGRSSLNLWHSKAYENGFKFKQEIIWNKRRGFGLTSKIINIHENIHIFMKGAPSFQDCRVDAYEYYKDYSINSFAVQNIFNNFRKFLTNEKEINDWIQFKFYGKNSIYNIYDKPYMSELISDVKLKAKRGTNDLKILSNGMKLKSIFSEIPDTAKTLGKKETGLGTHPTQKPIKVLQNVIKLCSKKEDVVLDMFMGTGSTAIACIDTQRKYIGCEILERYYEYSEKKIEEYKGVFNDIK